MSILEKITEDELCFMEGLHTPRCLVESLFSNMDNLTEFNEDKFCEVRIYQMPLMSDECLIDFEATAEYHKLDETQTFLLKKNVGDIYNYGGRKFGKSIITIILDLIVSMVHKVGTWAVLASSDWSKIQSILDRVRVVFEGHKILRLWKKSITSSTSEYKFKLNNNFRLESVNYKIGKKNSSANSAWYGKHADLVYIEEASLENASVAKDRVDALAEDGAIFRISGMTNFTRNSPSGQVFYDKDYAKHVVNLPQYVNPKYTKKQDKERLKKFGDVGSIFYRMFVKGEVVSDAEAVFDYDKIIVNDKKRIKFFELNDKSFENYKNKIIVERPVNAENVFICSDVSDIGTTEIIIIFEVNGKYYYHYNITLHGVDGDKSKEFFRWLALEVKANFIGIDSTDAHGRNVCRYLQSVFGQEHVIPVGFNEKIIVDYQKDEEGKIIKDKENKSIPIKEWIPEWSVNRLLKLFYNENLIINLDYKFETQITQVIVSKSGRRMTPKCTAEEDHIWQAFQVFSIVQWNVEFNLIAPVEESRPPSGGFRYL